MFDQEVFDKIMFWVDKSPVEVSGFGRVVIKDGNFTVVSAYLLDQENSGASTDIAPEAMAKLMYESREDEGHLNFWWHSHVNMAVYWSGTDTETIKQIGEQGWCLSTVFNKKDESRSAYYQKGDDFMPEIFMDDLESSTMYITDNKQAEWEEEYTKKCKAKKYLGANNYNTTGAVGDDLNMTSAELAEWWEEYNNRNDIIDRCALATNLKIADLTRAETIDLFDAFIETKGSEPISVIDLNTYFTRELKGDINEVYYQISNTTI